MILKQNLVAILLLLFTFTVSAQKVTLSGKIAASESNESLIGVTIYIEALEKSLLLKL